MTGGGGSFYDRGEGGRCYVPGLEKLLKNEGGELIGELSISVTDRLSRKNIKFFENNINFCTFRQ